MEHNWEFKINSFIYYQFIFHKAPRQFNKGRIVVFSTNDAVTVGNPQAKRPLPHIIHKNQLRGLSHRTDWKN